MCECGVNLQQNAAVAKKCQRAVSPVVQSGVRGRVVVMRGLAIAVATALCATGTLVFASEMTLWIALAWAFGGVALTMAALVVVAMVVLAD